MSNLEKIQKLAKFKTCSVSSQKHVKDLCLLHVQDHLITQYLKDPQGFENLPMGYLNKVATNAVNDFFQTVLPKVNGLSLYSKEVFVHVYDSINSNLDIETYFSLLPAYDQPIVRALYEGYTVQEIADLYGHNYSSLKTYIFRKKKYWENTFYAFENDSL